MSITLYSTLLALWSLMLGVWMILSFILFFVSPSIQKRLRSISYGHAIGLIALVASGAVIATLIYQFYYLVPVCSLCWWQRIFLFPIAIVAVVSSWKNIRENTIIITVLAFLGLLFSSYHSVLQLMKIFERDRGMITICDASGVSCSEYGDVLIFWFMTIPFMGLVLFGSIMILSFLVRRTHIQ